jgi:hypothetical protein
MIMPARSLKRDCLGRHLGSRGWWLFGTSLIILVFDALVFNAAQAQSLSPAKLREIFERSEPCIVQLSVRGTKDGRDVSTVLGTGFIIRTTTDAKIMTARHVVGLDEDFDPVPGTVSLRKRDIALRVVSAYGSAAVGPYHAARASRDFDIAQIFVDRGPKDCLSLSHLRPALDDELVVLTWAVGDARPSNVPVRVLPSVAEDGDLVRLDHEFHESQSGSPVIDGNGNVVAVLLVRDHVPGAEPFSAALPVAAFQNWISDAVYAAPVVEEATVEKRSGGKNSGTMANYSSFYELCSDPIPQGAAIIHQEFRLEGDRSCGGGWAECRISVQEPSRACYVFRMQGHNELPFSNAGVRQSEGVLRLTYQRTLER